MKAHPYMHRCVRRNDVRKNSRKPRSGGTFRRVPPLPFAETTSLMRTYTVGLATLFGLLYTRSFQHSCLFIYELQTLVLKVGGRREYHRTTCVSHAGPGVGFEITEI